MYIYVNMYIYTVGRDAMRQLTFLTDHRTRDNITYVVATTTGPLKKNKCLWLPRLSWSLSVEDSRPSVSIRASLG